MSADLAYNNLINFLNNVDKIKSNEEEVYHLVSKIIQKAGDTPETNVLALNVASYILSLVQLPKAFKMTAKEWGDQTLVSHKGSGIFPPSDMILPINYKLFQEKMERRQKGELVQDLFPELTPDQRDFIISGKPC